jgi:hypothetical protein
MQINNIRQKCMVDGNCVRDVEGVNRRGICHHAGHRVSILFSNLDRPERQEQKGSRHRAGGPERHEKSFARATKSALQRQCGRTSLPRHETAHA